VRACVCGGGVWEVGLPHLFCMSVKHGILLWGERINYKCSKTNWQGSWVTSKRDEVIEQCMISHGEGLWDLCRSFDVRTGLTGNVDGMGKNWEWYKNLWNSSLRRPPIRRPVREWTLGLVSMLWSWSLLVYDSVQ